MACVTKKRKRKVIQKQLEINTSNVPWDNVLEFSKLVLIEQIKDFNKGNENLVFFDRGIPDIVGYLNHARKKIFKELKKSCSLNRYDYIFILPWNLEQEIIEQLAYTRSWNCKFITAIPNLKII